VHVAAKVSRMSIIKPTTTPTFTQMHVADEAASVTEAVAGLLAHPAWLAPKWFYDALGSRLFDAITALPEYYPTRTEAAIFAQHGAAMAKALHERAGKVPTMVDLGAGNCEKAASLFDVFQPSSYVAVDISAAYLEGVLKRLQREHPTMRMAGVGMDFSSQLALPTALVDGRSLLFYPGSSISNFPPAQAAQFLTQARAQCQGGGLLIGVDLVKASEILEPAYDDALGVTAAFNRNVLTHINRVAGGNFDLNEWRHVAHFDREQSRIDMHLEAKHDTVVQFTHAAVLQNGEPATRHFEAGERIHTEHSYKWQRGDFEALLRGAGFAQVQTWTDEQQWFAVMLATA
jgi:L-histidine Nalpha-methyltransferase